MRYILIAILTLLASCAHWTPAQQAAFANSMSNTIQRETQNHNNSLRSLPPITPSPTTTTIHDATTGTTKTCTHYPDIRSMHCY